MRISVFGLGYVGCVSAACFARDGHTVIGVDVNSEKVGMIAAGKSPIVEEGLEELIRAMVESGRLTATTDTAEAVRNSDLSIVCVGTPSRPNGSLDLTFVQRVACEIGACLAGKADYHVVVMRSTMLPGTMNGLVIPTLESASGRKAGADFGVCVNPEFLREGTSLKDFYTPPFTLIGADEPEVVERVSALYGAVSAPLHIASLQAAEMVKYACNCFHALKVGFANEIGNVCKSAGIDSHEVMRIFCQDTKLNLSPYYLKPGYAFGGSCLPKDLRALHYKAREADLEVPILASILQSNRLQTERGVNMVLATGKKRVGLLGLSFKAGTDDLRESPLVTLAETLIGKGLQISIYDRDVSLARLYGANKQYIESEIPHISQLMCQRIDTLLETAEVLVIGNKNPEYEEALARRRPDQIVIDLVRLFPDRSSDEAYRGICW